MAVIFFAYAFDLPAFSASLEPWLTELDRGDFARLRHFVHHRALADQETRHLLDSVFLAHLYEDELPPAEADNPSGPDNLLLVLMKPHMRPLPLGRDFTNNGWKWPSLRRDIPALNWTRADARLVYEGVSLCHALGRAEMPVSWCQGQTFGWLDRGRLSTIHDKLRNACSCLEANPTTPLMAEPPLQAGQLLHREFCYLAGLMDECIALDCTMLVTVA